MKKVLIGLTLLASVTSFAAEYDAQITELIRTGNYRKLKKVCKKYNLTDVMAQRIYANCSDADSGESITVLNSFGLHRDCKDAEDLIIVQRGNANDQIRISSVHDFELSNSDFYASENTGWLRRSLNNVSIDFNSGNGIAISKGQYPMQMKLVDCKSSDEVTELFIK